MLVCSRCGGQGFVETNVRLTWTGKQGDKRLGRLWQPCSCNDYAPAAEALRAWMRGGARSLPEDRSDAA